MEETLEKLRRLIDKQNGPGISQNLIARYAQCTRQSINYYLHGYLKPSPYMIDQLEKSFQIIYEKMKNIMELDN